MKKQITSPDERVKKPVFLISGGAGRIICALPAFEKYLRMHPDGPEDIPDGSGGHQFYIVSQSGLEFFLGTEFQDVAFDPTHKGLFKDIIKPNNLINLEPYQEHGYYNQEKSLTQSFDKLINGTDAHGNLTRPKIVLSKTEEINAVNTVKECKKQHEKKYTVVIQPFGRNANQHDGGHVVDETSRSLSTDDYFYISNELRKKYNVISMTEIKFDNDVCMYVDADLRHWAAIIDAADYFIGIDSCGQHMAYAFDKPGSVILGSTFAENISYPKHFNIVEKPNSPRVYSPIRIDGMDGALANRVNDTCMDFSQKELEVITKNIIKDIEKKVGKSGTKPIVIPLNDNPIEKHNKARRTHSKGFIDMLGKSDIKPNIKPTSDPNLPPPKVEKYIEPVAPKGGCATDPTIQSIKKSCIDNVLSKKSSKKS